MNACRCIDIVFTPRAAILSTTAGIFKPGGDRGASHSEVLRCVESAKLRYKDVSELLEQSLAEHRNSRMDTE